MALLEVEDLWKVYRRGTVEVPALRGVSFTVERGEYVAIMGPSGSGKSTLMHILGCLLTPTSGRYLLEGVEVSTLSEDERARLRRERIGFVFQRFNLLPRLNLMENVALPLVYAGVPSRIRQERARAMLERVGLGHRLFHTPMEISGGEAQRAAIARALVSDPALILADEPTGNLDTRTGAQILDLFEALHREGRTLVLVTHDEEVARRAKRVLHIRDGEVVKDERPRRAGREVSR